MNVSTHKKYTFGSKVKGIGSLFSGGDHIIILGLVENITLSFRPPTTDSYVFMLSYNLLGLQNVYISITDAGYSNESYQMTSGSFTDVLPGILCENGEFFIKLILSGAL